jgi:alpha-D-ribose 1-methylphosphonate 5-triphosphate diphosphatase
MSWSIAVRRPETIGPIVEGLHTAIAHDMLRVEHVLHMRCEVTHPEIVPIFEAFLEDPLVRFMSLMDHAPGDRQSPDIVEYRQRYLKTFQGDEAAVDQHITELLHGSRVYGPDNRRRLAEVARRQAISFASHDDARPEHIEEAAGLGACLLSVYKEQHRMLVCYSLIKFLSLRVKSVPTPGEEFKLIVP